jgi:hypothetical protein
MAQAVSRRLLTAEAQFRLWVNPCGIFGGQSGTGTNFSPSSSLFPCQYKTTVALQLISTPTRIIWGKNHMSVGGSSSET